jgi:beta-glucosidase
MGLIEETCALSAREAAMEGINMIFAPMVDISRDPRWGRVAEGAGEDPYLGSEVARARVRGYQRNDWEDLPKIAACAKHYVAYGAPQGGRDYDGADISERSLREIYLPPFDAAVKAGVMSVMSSFNDLNGIPVSGNERAIRGILRGELGFEGVVVSDWESVEELVNHSIASDGKEAARLGFKAGVDIDMNSGVYERYLKELVREGKLTIEEIDEAAWRVLKLKERLGLFGKKRFVIEEARRLSLENPAAKELALKAARESMVLLKNRDLLPLRKGTKLAVIGQLADDRPDMLGCWAGQVEAQESVTVLEGLENLGEEFLYERGSEINSDIEGGIGKAREIAAKAQVVLMVLGETSSMSGENRSRADITIPAAQRRLLRSVMEVNENVVLVVVSGRPLVLSWEEANVPTILQLWQARPSGGQRACRNPLRHPQSLGEIDTDVPGRRRSDTDLLQQEKHGPSSLQEVYRYPGRTALPIRLGLELHGFRLRRSRALDRFSQGGRGAESERACHQPRRLRRLRDGYALREGCDGLRHQTGDGAQRFRKALPDGRPIEDRTVRNNGGDANFPRRKL